MENLSVTSSNILIYDVLTEIWMRSNGLSELEAGLIAGGTFQVWTAFDIHNIKLYVFVQQKLSRLTAR